MVIMEIYWEFTAGETKHLDVTDVDRFMIGEKRKSVSRLRISVLSFRLDGSSLKQLIQNLLTKEYYFGFAGVFRINEGILTMIDLM